MFLNLQSSFFFLSLKLILSVKSKMFFSCTTFLPARSQPTGHTAARSAALGFYVWSARLVQCYKEREKFGVGWTDHEQDFGSFVTQSQEWRVLDFL